MTAPTPCADMALSDQLEQDRERARLIAQLAAVTAERDRLRTELHRMRSTGMVTHPDGSRTPVLGSAERAASFYTTAEMLDALGLDYTPVGPGEPARSLLVHPVLIRLDRTEESRHGR